MFNTYLHLEPRLRMSGIKLLLPLFSCMALAGVNLPALLCGVRTSETSYFLRIWQMMHLFLFLSLPRSFCSLITHTNTHTHTHTHISIYYLRSLKFTLIHLKRSYIFRSHDHPQGAYIIPC